MISTSTMNTRLITPTISEFPKFLKSIEARWKIKVMRRFERERFMSGKNSGEKLPRYILSMFPYPSGRLHLGHVRIYTSSDVLTRYSRLMSKNLSPLNDFVNVINPMGFDSFGLPAENAARERRLDPAVWTSSNIRTMKKQLDDLAVQFDWREATSNPSFYRWTQNLFLKLMNAGLVYKSFAQVNWDPIDETVLADEQVDEGGRSWRSGAIVEKRYFRQWFIKVNAFTNEIWKADEVNPETWRDILAIQKGWIGTPCGWIFYLPIVTPGSKSTDVLPVFSRRPELFAMADTELVISSNHWLKAIYDVQNGSEMLNPFTGKNMKIYFTNSDDQLPAGTKATIQISHDNQPVNNLKHHIHRDQVLLQAKLFNLGGYYTSEKYRDWLVSRQRFWGTPIPAIHCNNCGSLGVDSKDLPVTLPKVSDLNFKLRPKSFTNDDKLHVISPIEVLAPEDWVNTKCPSCGNNATRECETFDTLFDSSWYFLRYSSEPCNDRSFDAEKVQPVWCYIGGKEHASMHLFYARFITHFLYSVGELKFREPFLNLLVQGVVKSKTYKLKGKYLSQEEADQVKDEKNLVVEYEKMSKSKGNGVDPQELIETYGVDATRFCLMSYANPRSERLWRSNEDEFREIMTFLRRIFLTIQQYADIGTNMLSKDTKKVKIKIEELDKMDLHNKKLMLVEQRNRASVDAIFNIQETNQFRQFISVLHVLTSVLRNNIKNSSVYTKEYAEALASLIVMLNPIIPHLSEELWAHFCRSIINPLRLDSTSSYNVLMQVSDQPWPLPDKDYGRSGCFNTNTALN